LPVLIPFSGPLAGERGRGVGTWRARDAGDRFTCGEVRAAVPPPPPPGRQRAPGGGTTAGDREGPLDSLALADYPPRWDDRLPASGRAVQRC